MSERFDPQEVKRRLPMLDLMASEGIAVRRDGHLRVAVCPFHSERTGSFTIYAYDDHAQDHAHCFGCGWNGDIFDLWEERHGVPFFAKCETCGGRGKEADGSQCAVCRGAGGLGALVECASLASCSPAFFASKRKQVSQVTRVADDPATHKKPILPRLRALDPTEIDALARLRFLDATAVELAARLKRVGACEWPQFMDRDGCWRRPCQAHFLKCRMDRPDCAPIPQFTSWVVTDSTRWVAQFRRLDGGKFTRKDGAEIKAWTKGKPAWPLGANEIGERAAVLLVEGGADMLAAFHFLAKFRRTERVAVCAILGASCAIMGEALPFFRRKRVRIVMDADAPNKKTGLIPSHEAAARWTAQLTQAGAAVESFSLEGLQQKDGSPVKDLNDLVKVDEAAWLDPELRAAFFDFDF